MDIPQVQGEGLCGGCLVVLHANEGSRTWCFGALVFFIKPTLSPPIPQRYGVIKVSYD